MSVELMAEWTFPEFPEAAGRIQDINGFELRIGTTDHEVTEIEDHHNISSFRIISVCS